MGRPGLTQNRKFRRLALTIGGKAISRGHLELMWDSAYESGDEVIGDSVDVELAAEWHGEPGKLTEALSSSGFIELVDGVYQIHDFWHHAPAYVRKRRARENERRSKVDPCRSSDQSVTSQDQVIDCRTAPLPHPHPHPHPHQEEVPPIVPHPKKQKQNKKDSLGGDIPKELLDAVGGIVSICPQQDRDGRQIRIVRGEILTRIQAIQLEHPSASFEILSQCWKDYLDSAPKNIKAPQYFFGKEEHQGPNGANWYPWAKAIYVRRQLAEKGGES